MITLEDITAAAQRIKGRVLHTPTVPCQTLSRATGADIVLKLDNLQAVGSFKERGAANKLALLTPRERERGVITVSAGNHAQGVARHASLLDIDAVIVMPRFTPAAKVTRTAAWGATVVLEGDNFAEATAHANMLCQREGRVFVHPYDDPEVMAGQGTFALELFEDAGPLDTFVCPIGGGGLLAGCAVAGQALQPNMDIIGVQVENFSSLAGFPGDEVLPPGGPTIAEGIAVLQIGRQPLEVIRELVSRVLVVTLIYMAGFSAMESVFGLWAEDRYAWGAREVGLSFMIVGIVSTLNQGFFAGKLARRFGESRVLAVGMLLFGASLVLQVISPVSWFPATSLELGALSIPIVQGWVIPIVMAFGACGMSLAMPNISAMISRASPPDRQGAMLGLNMASSSVARIFGPMIAGALFSGLGHDWPFLIGALLTIPAAVMAINAGRVIRRQKAAAEAVV